ncbi:MAG: ATP synthase F1 subunit gamma [Halobacteriovoraceae bacterium]|nr:ATP synthase F1 subunit gamma [Halobacteriovoraceae bacterium]
MANVKELKVKIGSTKSTLKITSAMKLVSAAKLSKAQLRVEGFKPYSIELDKTVRVAAALGENYKHEYLKEAISNKNAAILIISSDKGLCGGYNSSLARKVKGFVQADAETNYKLYFIGKKVKELLAFDGFKQTKTFAYAKADPSFNEAQLIVDELAEHFKNDEIGKLYVAYNSFLSVIEFDSTVKQVLPMTVSGEEKEALLKEFPVDFKYEPSPEGILDNLIPEVLNTTVFTSMLDAVAAEHATRMTAMDNATTNSKDMIKKLTITMNKLRQAAITTELSEIVSGAESLNS